jgi:hypothetical protein
MSMRHIRLWSQDYTQVLCESSDLEEVKRYFASSDLDWCGLTVNRGGDARDTAGASPRCKLIAW